MPENTSTDSRSLENLCSKYNWLTFWPQEKHTRPLKSVACGKSTSVHISAEERKLILFFPQYRLLVCVCVCVCVCVFRVVRLINTSEQSRLTMKFKTYLPQDKRGAGCGLNTINWAGQSNLLRVVWWQMPVLSNSLQWHVFVFHIGDFFFKKGDNSVLLSTTWTPLTLAWATRAAASMRHRLHWNVI